MQVPLVVIVGRPNVGKSSLFNAIYGGRVAIVEPTAGVTRDRISRIIQNEETAFELMDTGGMGVEEELADHIELQIRIAIEQAELVLMVVDGKAGLQPLDREIAEELRRAEKDVIVVVNKCDRPRENELALADFYGLGFDEVTATSATHRLGVAELRERLEAVLPRVPPAETKEPMKIAFVGRRNVGKSTLVNYLARAPRVVVSELPGTTRDSVDVHFQLGGIEFLAIDTAGVRRPKQIKDSIEFYSSARTFNSIRRADVVVHMIDAADEVARLDKQIASHIIEEYKPCILAVNKLDLAEGTTQEQWREYVRDRMPGIAFAPRAFISAATGEGVLELIRLAQALHEQSFVRVSTGDLIGAIKEITDRRRPPSTRSRQSKIYYATQVGVKPPTIVMFCNYPHLIKANYLRYLGAQLRQRFPFTSIPIKFFVRGRTHEPGQRKK
ncbi:MAG: ribosome biogenesis GTPase Der [Planctomycetes bacterium]|nr:ribosome biogenesis GTPase Der [Planctomycetota bacterium]